MLRRVARASPGRSAGLRRLEYRSAYWSPPDTPSVRAPGLRELVDGLGQREDAAGGRAGGGRCAAGGAGDDAAAGAAGVVEGVDDLAGLGDLVGRRGEDAVAWLELAGVDEGLAVEAELPALQAFRLEAGRVADVVVDAVQDHLAGRAGGQQGQREGAEQGCPA